jgi:Protein of unknown function (DUF1549)/Protein of unknown function (DUF1553)
MSHLRPCRIVWILCFVTMPSIAVAQAPLHQRIDQHIQKGLKEGVTRADDAEFVRRVYLNLTGIIPSTDESRTFLADKTPDKRAKLVDKLLASDGYARHFTNLFDILLMDRRPSKHVKLPEWRDFLQTSFAQNKPYDQFVREILSADGSNPKTRPASRFYLDRDGEPNVLTKDISRLFLGMNLHCAQCHDHPLVDAYKQDHYYGVMAFLSRSYVFADKATKVSIYAEKAEGDVTFQSVFVPKVTKNTTPRLPDGRPIDEPKFDKGQEYVKPVGKGERGIPKFSRRALLAEQIVGKDNPRFPRATANRLWSFMMGRGIVEPVEYDHPANPPSHPELLQMLSDELAASKYDVKALIRAIALSEAYQRSSEMPKGKEADPKTFAVAALKPLTPEQFAWSLMQATGLIAAERKALGPKATEAAVYAKLSGQMPAFVALFGSQPGDAAFNQDFEATLDQTLFLINGPTLRGWLTPRPGNLIDRLNSQKESSLVAEELYLSVLSRMPNDEERKEVADYLARRGAARVPALQDLAWALLTSAEFRFNH